MGEESRGSEVRGDKPVDIDLVAGDTTSAVERLIQVMSAASEDLVRSDVANLTARVDSALAVVARALGAQRAIIQTVDDRHFRANCDYEWHDGFAGSIRDHSARADLDQLPWSITDLERETEVFEQGGRVSVGLGVDAVLGIPVVARHRLAILLSIHWVGEPVELEKAVLPALRLFAHQVQLLVAQSKLQERASYDDLTGLANQKLVLVTLNRMVARLKRARGVGLAVLLCEIEGLDQLSQDVGRVEGDRALSLVAQRLEMSTREDDLVGRFAEHMFVVLCEDVATGAEALGVGERLRADLLSNLRETFPSNSGDLEVVVGVSHTGRDDNAGVLLRRADSAIYLARRPNGPRVVIGTD